MGKKYYQTEILSNLDKFLNLNDISTLYKDNLIDHKGYTYKSNGEKKYTEIIAAKLLNHIDMFEKIEQIIREKSYDCRHKFINMLPSDKITEKRIAKSMKGKSYEYIGKIIDYQTPLKNKNDKVNKGLGEIDLLSWNNEKNWLYLIEFKKPTSNETLLRAVLEIETYYRIIDHDKLVKDFNNNDDFAISESVSIRKAVLAYEDSQPHKDFKHEQGNNIKKLMNRLGIDLFILSSVKNINADKIAETQKIVEHYFCENLGN